MSSPKGSINRDKSAEGIAKPARETERCAVGRGSRLPSHARSPSTSGQRSKIPTNIGRPGAAAQNQPQDNSRLLPSVVSEDSAGAAKGSPINTSRRLSSRSATASSFPPAAPTSSKPKPSTVSNATSAAQRRQLESQLSTKRKRYATLKKELTDKQKNALDLYEELSQLRDKLIAHGVKDPGKIETINLTPIPARTSVPQLSLDLQTLRGSGEEVYAPNSDITGDLVSTLESKIRESPNRCLDLCREALENRSKIFGLLEKLDGETAGKIDPETAEKLEAHRKEHSELETRLEETRKTEEAAIAETIGKLSALWNEIDASRRRIHELEVTSAEMINESRGKLDAALAEKKWETEKSAQLHERKVALETELQKARAKMKAMETRFAEDETKIAQLQGNVKNLEGQLRQKESSAEQRFKEMQKSLKNSENLLAKTEKQRDSFESRLNELKKSHGSRETEANNRIKELSDKLEAAKAELDKHMETCRLEDVRNDVEALIDRDTIDALKREKKQIITLMQHLLFDDANSFKFDADGPHDKIVVNLTKRMEEFRLNFKTTQAKNERLDKQVAELRCQLQSKSKETGGGKSAGYTQAIDLGPQVYDLRCNVKELKRRNEELEIQLNQKQLEIEDHDRAMREQINVLKVRDEVIALLKGKPDSRGNSDGLSLPVVKKKNQRDREQVDKHIAEKTENLQQLYSTLENKQMQITRLEHLVKQMELQQDRAQEQRTRLETKIAQLQLAMHYRGKNHRYVKTESPASPTKVSSANVERSPFHESSKDQESISHPRSFSRPPPPRSPTRHPQIQRSKTLNSFQTKTKLSPSKEYACKVMDEVARTLKRERAYDYEKRAMREDRGSEYVAGNVVDPRDISKEEIHESFYNWLVEPWMFEGEPSNLILPTSDLRRNHWQRVRSPNSDMALNVGDPEDRSPRRQRATNDCSRESRCGSPECRRQSVPDWNPGSARVRTSPQNSPATRSRLQRS